MKKRLISIFLVIALCLSLAGCSKEKKIEYCELGIILTKDFDPYDSKGVFDVAYSDGNTIVGFIRYSFVDCEEYGFLSTYSPLKFAEAYINKMGYGSEDGVKTQGDIPYFAYVSTPQDGDSRFYMHTFYCTPYAYFVITYITSALREVEGRVEFLKYASTAYILSEHL